MRRGTRTAGARVVFSGLSGRRGAAGCAGSAAPVDAGGMETRAALVAGDAIAVDTRAERGTQGPGAALVVALGVAVAHGLNDAYAAFLHPLLPRIMDRLGLSIALAATLAMTLSLASSVLQPVMGWLADRYGHRPFVVLGPLLSGVFLSLIGVAPTFAALAVCLALGGLGSAAFHPPGASLAARVSEGGASGARFSYFSFGGALGYAVGPLAAVGIVAAFGLERLWLAMLPVLVLALPLYRLLPAPRAERPAAPPPSFATALRLLAGPLGLVFGISAVGAFVQRLFLTFEPIIVHAAGGTEALGALMLSIYLGGQAVGTLVGGALTDRMDRRRLLVLLSTLSLPAHIAALALAPGSSPALAAAFVAGLLNMALLPPVVVMAQELTPGGAAVGAGIAMGLAWATGSIGVLGVGVLGDAWGAQTAALAAMPVMLLGTAFALHPSLPRRPS
jgi:FSR family fosmidomycin resistance protein-like MFS transporter